jgi:hypothetical protein
MMIKHRPPNAGSKRRHTMKTITVKLEDLIEVAGKKIAEVTIRKPIVKDLKLSNAAGNELERSLKLIADLAGLAPEEIDQISLTDLGKINEEMAKANFIPSAPMQPNK